MFFNTCGIVLFSQVFLPQVLLDIIEQNYFNGALVCSAQESISGDLYIYVQLWGSQSSESFSSVDNLSRFVKGLGYFPNNYNLVMTTGYYDAISMKLNFGDISSVLLHAADHLIVERYWCSCLDL
jgi:hypothetical protein